MSLDSFHPLVARWFTTTLGDPTPTQSRGWRAIRGRRHTLIARAESDVLHFDIRLQGEAETVFFAF